MKTALTVALALALATTAQAHTKHLTVDQTARWETPQTFGPNAVVVMDGFVNGHPLSKRVYSDSGVFYRGRGVIIEVRSAPKKRSHLRFRIANFRKRDARVRLTYRRL